MLLLRMALHWVLLRPFKTQEQALRAVQAATRSGYLLARLSLPVFLSHRSLVVRARAYAELGGLGVSETTLLVVAARSWEQTPDLRTYSDEPEVNAFRLTSAIAREDFTRHLYTTGLLQKLQPTQIATFYLTVLLRITKAGARTGIKYYWSEIIQGEAIKALGYFRSSQAARALADILTDLSFSPSLRRLAAISLGLIPDVDSLAALIAGLSDKTFGVREASATALGRLRLDGAVEALICALDDPIVQVRIAAAEALAEIADRRAAEPLLARLQRPPSLHAPSIRTALRGDHFFDTTRMDLPEGDLGFGTSRGRGISREEYDRIFDRNHTIYILQKQLDRFSDYDAYVRQRVAFARALGHLRAEDSVESLLKMLSIHDIGNGDASDFRCFRAAVEALTQIGGTLPAATLLGHLRKTRPHESSVARILINALTRLNHVEAASVISLFLDSRAVCERSIETRSPQLREFPWLTYQSPRPWSSETFQFELGVVAASGLVHLIGKSACPQVLERIKSATTDFVDAPRDRMTLYGLCLACAAAAPDRVESLLDQVLVSTSKHYYVLRMREILHSATSEFFARGCDKEVLWM